MTALTPILCARSGGGNLAGAITPTNGDTMPAGYNSFLYVKNANAAVCTVTVTPPTGGGPLGTTVAPFALSPTVALTTGDRIYGPFPATPFGDANGNVTALCSTTGATVQVAALLMSTS